ncbi:Rhodanese domain-containing protein [Candidatus Magnetomoraceae bacterium gMMP-15]
MNILKKTLKESLLILIITISAALLINGLRPDGIKLNISFFQPAINKEIINKETAADQQETGEIPFKRAVKMFHNNKALFLDARSLEDYETGHIKGAESFPVHDFEMLIGEFIETTDPETIIITYCDGDDCPLAHELSEQLSYVGFEKAFHLKNGWGRWRENSLPGE